MEKKDFVQGLLSDAEYQLSKAVEGAQPSFWAMKVTDGAMSPLDQLEHLCECYQAVITKRAGGSHDWGTFRLTDRTPSGAAESMKRLRNDAVSACEAAGDEGLEDIHHFIVAHDYYHVGQLCLARLKDDPTWNAYSIYKSHG